MERGEVLLAALWPATINILHHSVQHSIELVVLRNPATMS